MKRSAARLLLRPATLLANAADIAGLKAFLKRQAERYDTLAAPIVVITGDRDTVVSPRHHAMRLAAAVRPDRRTAHRCVSRAGRCARLALGLHLAR